MSNDQSGVPQNPGQQPPAYPGAPVPPQQPAQGYPGAPAPQQPYPGAAPVAPGYPQPQPPAYGQPQPYTQPYGQPYPMPARSNGLAIASMICGIASVVFCWAYLILPLLAGVPAVIMGHMSLKKIQEDRTLGGKGLALTGLITGYVGIGLGLLFGLFIILALVAAFSYRSGYSY